MNGTVTVDLRPYLKPVHTSERPSQAGTPTELQRQIVAAYISSAVAAMKRMVEAMEQLTKSTAAAAPHIEDVLRVARKAQTTTPWAGNIATQKRRRKL